MKQIFKILSITLLFSQSLYAQLDSIYDQGTYRTFIMHLPTGYDDSKEYPLVLNLHGLRANAQQQQTYSQFDDVADQKGFIVVYPNAIDESWSTSGNTDIDFLTHLVDSIRAEYSTNDCLFVTGFSQGGFMTYKFANNTTHAIKAIVVGSGNMSNATQTASENAPQIPTMHFHGTADNTVPYGGSSLFIPPVENTIEWWVNHNNCNTTPVVTSIPDLDPTDNSTVEKYYYGNGDHGTEVTFYKVIGGGHTWSGSYSIPLFGATNKDINQSEIIGDFFDSKCSPILSLEESDNKAIIKTYPNPFNEQLLVTTDMKTTINIYNSLGQSVITKIVKTTSEIDTKDLLPGIYFYEIIQSQKHLKSGKLMKK
jgi:polyhydroxybutyrate depolymerase